MFRSYIIQEYYTFIIKIKSRNISLKKLNACRNVLDRCNLPDLKVSFISILKILECLFPENRQCLSTVCRDYNNYLLKMGYYRKIKNSHIYIYIYTSSYLCRVMSLIAKTSKFISIKNILE